MPSWVCSELWNCFGAWNCFGTWLLFGTVAIVCIMACIYNMFVWCWSAGMDPCYMMRLHIWTLMSMFHSVWCHDFGYYIRLCKMLWIESKMVKGAMLGVLCLWAIRNLRWFSGKRRCWYIYENKWFSNWWWEHWFFIMDVISWHQMVIVGIDDNSTME